VDALAQNGVAENTVVIVTSDNGALPGDRVNAAHTIDGYDLYGHKSCGDWRGYKAHIWEGGHRVPFVVGPASGGEADPPDGGVVETTAACLTDLYETLFGLADADSDGTARDSIDLSSCAGFRRWARTSASRPKRRRALIHHSGSGVYSARVGEWKLIYESRGSGGWPPPAGGGPEPGSPGQLYNLYEDPGETTDLYSDRPGTVSELAELLRSFRDGAPSVEQESARKEDK
jgi:arylsulfatase A-like enzyme